MPKITRRSLSVLLLFACHVNAHEFWIEPSNFHPKSGEKVDLFLYVGKDFVGEGVVRVPEWFTRFELDSTHGRQLTHGDMGDEPAGHAVVIEPGIHVAVYRSTPTHIDFEPEKFLEYLNREGLERIDKKRREVGEENSPVGEYYSRYAKTFIQVGDETAGYDHDTGLEFEMTPRQNPLNLAAGQSLTVHLQYHGQPVEDALVVGFTKGKPLKKEKVRTDKNGTATIKLPHNGLWLFNSVKMIRASKELKDAQWESFWASMIFQVK